MTLNDFLKAQTAPLIRARDRLKLPEINMNELMRRFRILSYRASGFEKFDGRVVLSQESTAEAAVEHIFNGESSPASLYRLRVMQIWKTWERDRIIGCFTPQALEETCRTSWWKDYPADLLIDSFNPWSVYISLEGIADSEGDSSRFGGFFAGFEYASGTLCLVIQQIGLSGDWLPEFLHIYPIRRGQRLGDAVAEYGFRKGDAEYLKHFFKEALEVPEEEVYAMLTTLGERVASYAFPLLIAMMSGEIVERKSFEMEGDGRIVRLADSEIPMRNFDSMNDQKGEGSGSQKSGDGMRIFLMRLSEAERDGGLN